MKSDIPAKKELCNMIGALSRKFDNQLKMKDLNPDKLRSDFSKFSRKSNKIITSLDKVKFLDDINGQEYIFQYLREKFPNVDGEFFLYLYEQYHNVCDLRCICEYCGSHSDDYTYYFLIVFKEENRLRYKFLMQEISKNLRIASEYEVCDPILLNQETFYSLIIKYPSIVYHLLEDFNPRLIIECLKTEV